MESPKVTLQFEFEGQEQSFSQEALVDLVQNVRERSLSNSTKVRAYLQN